MVVHPRRRAAVEELLEELLGLLLLGLLVLLLLLVVLARPRVHHLLELLLGLARAHLVHGLLERLRERLPPATGVAEQHADDQDAGHRGERDGQAQEARTLAQLVHDRLCGR